MFGMIKRLFAGIYVGMGQTHYDKDEINYARAQFQRALRIAPDHYEARAMLGATLRIEEKFKEAIQELSIAIENKPKLDKAWRIRGLSKLGINDTSGAISDCLKALELKKDVRNLVALATAYTVAKDFKSAEQYFDEASKIDPKSAALNDHLGDCYAAQNKLSEAQRAYRKAVRADSKDANSYAKLARVTEKMGDLKEALTLYTRAGFLDAKNAEYRCDAARVAILDGDKSGSVFLYQEAVKLDPDCLVALVALGNNALELGDLAKAQSYAYRALAAHQDSWEANYFMAMVCKATGDDAGYEDYLRHARLIDATAVKAELLKSLAVLILAIAEKNHK